MNQVALLMTVFDLFAIQKPSLSAYFSCKVLAMIYILLKTHSEPQVEISGTNNIDNLSRVLSAYFS